MQGLIKEGIFVLFIFLPLVLKGQTKDELKRQKLEIENEIKYTSELLNKNNANKTQSLNYLKVLKRKITSHERLLITLNIEINLLDKRVNRIG